jgi:hypothetical protein
VTAGIALLAIQALAKRRLTVVVWFGAVVLVLPIATVPLAEVLLIAGWVKPS